MAIQIPNPGTGNGATGDNEFVLWSKVKANFEDQTHAASRLVGTASNNLMPVGAFGVGQAAASPIDAAIPVHNLPNGFFTYPDGWSGRPTKMGQYDTYGIKMGRHANGLGAAFFLPYHTVSSKQVCLRAFGGTNNSDYYFWTDRNTTTDSNGFVKAASPIVKVHADKVELNDDAETQNVTFTKNGVGDYTINTVSGLSTDGWYLELPKDLNGNPKIAVTLSETDGVISLKSYKRIFSMETFTFTPDLEQPLDIPDGRWIDLRLNEIEQPEMQPEV